MDENLGQIAAEALIGLARAFGGEDVGEEWEIGGGEEGLTIENLSRAVDGVVASLKTGKFR